jgi:hypothetical protein
MGDAGGDTTTGDDSTVDAVGVGPVPLRIR